MAVSEEESAATLRELAELLAALPEVPVGELRGVPEQLELELPLED